MTLGAPLKKDCARYNCQAKVAAVSTIKRRLSSSVGVVELSLHAASCVAYITPLYLIHSLWRVSQTYNDMWRHLSTAIAARCHKSWAKPLFGACPQEDTTTGGLLTSKYQQDRPSPERSRAEALGRDFSVKVHQFMMRAIPRMMDSSFPDLQKLARYL